MPITLVAQPAKNLAFSPTDASDIEVQISRARGAAMKQKDYSSPTMVIEELVEKRYLGKMRQPR